MLCFVLEPSTEQKQITTASTTARVVSMQNVGKENTVMKMSVLKDALTVIEVQGAMSIAKMQTVNPVAPALNQKTAMYVFLDIIQDHIKTAHLCVH